LIIETRSPEETVELGRKLGEQLAAGDVIALIGQLGAGKTQLTRGIAIGIGSAGRVTSPTFKLVNEYDGRVRVYHIDAYRLHGADDLVALGCDEFFDGDGAAVVEWADLVAEALPDDRVRVDIAITGAASRRLTFSTTGPNAQRLIDAAMAEPR
jgi:tRNA threonylcarbamoyladenosine biosynthesis protein TsaE